MSKFPYLIKHCTLLYVYVALRLCHKLKRVNSKVRLTSLSSAHESCIDGFFHFFPHLRVCIDIHFHGFFYPLHLICSLNALKLGVIVLIFLKRFFPQEPEIALNS